MSVSSALACESMAALRERALLAVRFSVAHRAIAAFCYGILPEREMTVDFAKGRFTIGRRPTNVPLSRLLESLPTVNVDGAALTQAFSAYCLRARARCTMLDLSHDSSAVCAMAGISRGLRNAIAFGNRALPNHVAQSAADRIDIVLLMLVGQHVSLEYARSVRVLEEIQQTGAPPGSRAQWFDQTMRMIGWNIAPEAAMIVLDVMVPRPARSARERLSSRSRIASLLHG